MQQWLELQHQFGLEEPLMVEHFHQSAVVIAFRQQMTRRPDFHHLGLILREVLLVWGWWRDPIVRQDEKS